MLTRVLPMRMVESRRVGLASMMRSCSPTEGFSSPMRLSWRGSTEKKAVSELEKYAEQAVRKTKRTARMMGVMGLRLKVKS